MRRQRSSEEIWKAADGSPSAHLAAAGRTPRAAEHLLPAQQQGWGAAYRSLRIARDTLGHPCFARWQPAYRRRRTNTCSLLHYASTMTFIPRWFWAALFATTTYGQQVADPNFDSRALKSRSTIRRQQIPGSSKGRSCPSRCSENVKRFFSSAALGHPHVGDYLETRSEVPPRMNSSRSEPRLSPVWHPRNHVQPSSGCEVKTTF